MLTIDEAQSKQFARRIEQQAKGSAGDPLCTGDHLKAVAEYLCRPLKATPKSESYRPRVLCPFIWHYELRSRGCLNVKTYNHVAEFERMLEEDPPAYAACLLFLTGHPTPEWLNALGGELDLDAVYLSEHMAFRPTIFPDTFAFPAMPSAGRNIIRLTVPIVGQVEPLRTALPSTDIHSLRQTCSAKLRDKARVWDSSGQAGMPVVRRFFLHDTNRFTIEQDISISLIYEGRRWTLLVWYDAGAGSIGPDLLLTEITGYERSTLVLTPIVQDARRILAAQSSHGHCPTQPRRNETFGLLAAQYGKLLVAELAAQDPFYALTEIFDLVASAELQFVNMMSQLITEQIELVGDDSEHAPKLADFQHSRELLEQHMHRLKEMADLLEKRSNLDWPTASDAEQRVLTEKARDTLHRQYRYLLERVSALVEKSDKGAELVLNSANLLLAQRSFMYSQTLGRLTMIGTWVAILYVPLSFLTSIFGMNFREGAARR
ncbi:hypothetical protein LTR85_003222 [Meristemomyces frigidus]|nr:hypothetical protein LTR85_003222 [Meristemomyces frigidus]